MLGKFVLSFTVVLGVAAVNTGNNLLYLILGSVFGMITASGILSEQSMRRLHASRSFGYLLAGEPGPITYQLRNLKPRQTAYLIELHEDPELPARVEAALFSAVAPLQTARARCRLTFAARGVYPLRTLTIETRYPFDFYVRSYEAPIYDEIVVAPAAIRHGPAPVAVADALQHGRQDIEYDRVRPMVSGDPLRMTHWKQTAARGSYMVRSGEGQGQSSMTLDLDQCQTEPDLENLCWWLRDARQRKIPLALRTARGLLTIHDSVSEMQAMRELAVHPLARAAENNHGQR